MLTVLCIYIDGRHTYRTPCPIDMPEPVDTRIRRLIGIGFDKRKIVRNSGGMEGKASRETKSEVSILFQPRFNSTQTVIFGSYRSVRGRQCAIQFVVSHTAEYLILTAFPAHSRSM